MRSFLLLATLTLTCTPAAAQICAPPPFPSGQPALAPFAPVCIGVVPPPVVWVAGNPGFALASFAPAPVPPGMPTALLFGLPPPAPIPFFGFFPPFGLPGLLAAGPAGLVALPAGPSGPVPGPPIPLPLPPTGGPVGTVGVHTIVLMPVGVALTAAHWITI